MNDQTAPHADLPVRASDAEREHTVALLQHGFTDGRLTQAELEERAAAAYAARTTVELSELTADLPSEQQQQQSRRGMVLDRRLLCILCCVHPPAGLVYWLLCLRRSRPRPPTVSRQESAFGSERTAQIAANT
jgi:hypothetical protein